MKKKLTRFLLCSVILFSCKIVNAQSTVSILDLNPGTDIDSAMSSANKVRLTINFKIVNIAQADSVFFKFGTTPGGAEITTENGKFTKTGANYFVRTQGPTYQVINDEASCKVKILSSQYTAATYLSLVVKDKLGLFTNVLHIRIN